MLSSFKRYSPFIIVFAAIALVWFIRFDNLNDPYFWDELGVYGSGVQYMVENGVSLQPKNLPPEISRGHPLLFYAMHASVLSIFGNSVVVSHAFSLLISSVLLLVVFYLAKEILPKTLAAFAVLYLAAQNIFLAQSSLVIPEISIALCAALGVLLFIKKRYLCSAIVLSLGVLIKESAILIPAFIAFYILFDALFIQGKWTKIFKAFYYLIPLAVLFIFLQIQYVQNGWYFFPYHTDIVKADALVLFKEKLIDHSLFIFTAQNRYWLSLALVPAVFFGLINLNKKIGFFIYFLVANIAVFSLAFYMDRYVLYVYPFIIVLSLYGLLQIVPFSKIAQYVLVITASIYCILSVNDRTFNYDSSLAYEDLLHAHQDALTWLCGNIDESIKIEGDYFIKKSVEQSAFGYVENTCIKKFIQEDANKTLYVYFNEVNEPSIKLLHKITRNEAQVFIYQ